MSKQTHTDACIKGNETFYARSGQQAIDKRRKLWHDHMQRVEANKARPLDDFVAGQTHMTAKAIVAQYITRKKKNVNRKTIVKNYGISYSLFYRYSRFNDGIELSKGEMINAYVNKNFDQINAAIDKSPSPTIEEVKRLYALAKPEINRPAAEANSKPKEDHIEDYDHMLNDEQKVELMDLANLELAEIKPVTKSDVVTGVIVGAIVGASMAAYLFMSHGVI